MFSFSFWTLVVFVWNRWNTFSAHAHGGRWGGWRRWWRVTFWNFSFLILQVQWLGKVCLRIYIKISLSIQEIVQCLWKLACLHNICVDFWLADMHLSCTTSEIVMPRSFKHRNAMVVANGSIPCEEPASLRLVLTNIMIFLLVTSMTVPAVCISMKQNKVYVSPVPCFACLLFPQQWSNPTISRFCCSYSCCLFSRLASLAAIATRDIVSERLLNVCVGMVPTLSVSSMSCKGVNWILLIVAAAIKRVVRRDLLLSKCDEFSQLKAAWHLVQVAERWRWMEMCETAAQESCARLFVHLMWCNSRLNWSAVTMTMSGKGLVESACVIEALLLR